jgi:hypothetical protein
MPNTGLIVGIAVTIIVCAATAVAMLLHLPGNLEQ